VSMKDLLVTWDGLARAAAVEAFPPVDAVVERGTVLCDPASEAELVAAEERLGQRLPRSYRQFLACSNGAHAGVNGLVTQAESAASDRPTASYGLYPVQLVLPFAQAQPDLFELWADTDFGDPITADGEEVADYTALDGRSLLIGSDSEWPTVLVKVGRTGDWQLWQFAKEGAVGYFSFGSWLRSETEAARASMVSELIERCSAGDLKALGELKKVRDSDALPQLTAALQVGGQVTTAAIEALGRIGGEPAARALAPFLDPDALYEYSQEIGQSYRNRKRPPGVDPDWHRTAQDALVRMRLAAADDVLAAYDCAHGLALRRDHRAAEIVFRREFKPPMFIGANELGLLGDPRYVPQLRAAVPLADKRRVYYLHLARWSCGDPEVIDDLCKIADDPAVSPGRRHQAGFLVEREARERRFT